MWPAWFELHSDPEILRYPVALHVYAALVRKHPTMLWEPTDVKAWVLGECLHTHRTTVDRALNLLIAHGYLLLHGYGQNRVRRLTIVPIRDVATASAA